MKQPKAILGSQGSHNPITPARVRDTVFKFEASSNVSTVSSGGQFVIEADAGPSFPGARDRWGVDATGFRLSDFFQSSFYTKYDYFRIVKIEYVGSLATLPRGSVPNVQVWTSIDWDDANVPASISTFMQRPNKSLTNFTTAAPTQTLVTYKPRRRISSNVDPSQQVVTKPDEWCDMAYANTLLFGNLKFGIIVPDGIEQYPVDNGNCKVLVTSKIWVEFKGRIFDA